VNYPFEDMMRLVALESWRLRTVVIGENLGTVPEGFNDQIARAGMLGMQVLWFERQHWGDNAPFKPPAHWSPESIGMTTTHDLPTVAGWWGGRDLEWRARLGLFADGANQKEQWRVRERDREQLVHALNAAGLASDQVDASAPQAPVNAIFEFIGRANCPLVVVPLEDVLALEEQPNIPGTIATHPNWRRRIDVPVEQLLNDKQVSQRLDSLLQARKES
jgi:4-alpha-glucanotransferase